MAAVTIGRRCWRGFVADPSPEDERLLTDLLGAVSLK
jgi:hypothetical protein